MRVVEGGRVFNEVEDLLEAACFTKLVKRVGNEVHLPKVVRALLRPHLHLSRVGDRVGDVFDPSVTVKHASLSHGLIEASECP